MFVTLKSGEAQVGVQFKEKVCKVGTDKVQRLPDRLVNKHGITTVVPGRPILRDGKPVVVPAPEVTRRVTELKVTLPGGEELLVEAVCDSADQFSFAGGRLAAVKKLLKLDDEQSKKRAAAKTSGKPLRFESKAHRSLSREDRATLVRFVCPFLYRKDATVLAVREKALLQRLKAKYEPEAVVDVKQAAK